MKLDSAWILSHQDAIDDRTARFLLSVHQEGRLPLLPEAVRILRARAGGDRTPIPPVPPKAAPAPERTEFF